MPSPRRSRDCRHFGKHTGWRRQGRGSRRRRWVQLVCVVGWPSPKAEGAFVQPHDPIGGHPPDILPAGGAELIFDKHWLEAEHHTFFELLRVAWRERRQVMGGAADAVPSEIQVLLVTGVAGNLDADFCQIGK